MMITRAMESCTTRRPALVRWWHTGMIQRWICRSGCFATIRRPTFPLEGNGSGRGSAVVQRFAVQSVDPGCLEGVLIRRSIPAPRVLTRSRSFGGEGCKKNDETDVCSLSRFP